MATFERGLHSAGLKETLGLPYWDWTDGPDDDQLQVPCFADESNWLNGIIKNFSDPGDITTRYPHVQIFAVTN